MRYWSVFCLLIVGLFASVTLLSVRSAVEAADPVTVTFTILRLSSDEAHCDEGALVPCPDDQYVKVSIDGQGEQREDWCDNCTYDFSPNWVFTAPVDPSHNPATIHVELWDREVSSKDDQLDIASAIPGNGEGLDLTVDRNSACGREVSSLRRRAPVLALPVNQRALAAGPTGSTSRWARRRASTVMATASPTLWNSRASVPV